MLRTKGTGKGSLAKWKHTLAFRVKRSSVNTMGVIGKEKKKTTKPSVQEKVAHENHAQQ